MRDDLMQLFRFRVRTRFTADNLPVMAGTNPLPVFSASGQLLGFASFEQSQRDWATVVISIDMHSPERLDLETGARPYWLDARMEFRAYLGAKGPSEVLVHALALTTEPIEGQDPIDLLAGCLV